MKIEYYKHVLNIKSIVRNSGDDIAAFCRAMDKAYTPDRRELMWFTAPQAWWANGKGWMVYVRSRSVLINPNRPLGYNKKMLIGSLSERNTSIQFS